MTRRGQQLTPAETRVALLIARAVNDEPFPAHLLASLRELIGSDEVAAVRVPHESAAADST